MSDKFCHLLQKRRRKVEKRYQRDPITPQMLTLATVLLTATQILFATEIFSSGPDTTFSASIYFPAMGFRSSANCS